MYIWKRTVPSTALSEQLSGEANRLYLNGSEKKRLQRLGLRIMKSASDARMTVAYAAGIFRRPAAL